MIPNYTTLLVLFTHFRRYLVKKQMGSLKNSQYTHTGVIQVEKNLWNDFFKSKLSI